MSETDVWVGLATVAWALIVIAAMLFAAARERLNR